MDNTQDELNTLLKALGADLGQKAWRVDEAKSKLSTVMSLCRSGHVELIGVRDPVLMISASVLTRLAREIGGAQTWGALFDPTAEYPTIPYEAALFAPDEAEAPSYSLDIASE